MKKLCVFLLTLVVIGTLFSGCNNTPEDITDDPYNIMGDDPYDIRNEGGFNVFVAKKIAREVREDGWVFSFIRNIDKTGDDSEIIKNQFFGINIRYRFHDEFTKIQSHTLDDGTVVYEKYTPAVMIWGQGSEGQAQDMAMVEDLLGDSATDESLLALTTDDLSFSELDEDMFLRLLQEALTSDPQKEGTVLSYWEKPTYAFLVEQNYIDGYKFQVAFLQDTGCVDELFIDVLYREGDEITEYVQLSDLVASGDATQAQNELYQTISLIVESIKTEETFLAGSDEYKDRIIADVELSRLYAFLKNIHNNDLTAYQEDPIVEIVEGID